MLEQPDNSFLSAAALLGSCTMSEDGLGPRLGRGTDQCIHSQ